MHSFEPFIAPKISSEFLTKEEIQMNFDYLRRKTVCQTTGLPPSTLYAKIAAGEFPKPVKLGKRAVGWLSTDIEDWKRKQLEASND